MSKAPPKPIRQQVRQGQTRWMAVLYKPGSFSDLPDSYVGKVFRCFVTAAFGTTVKYDCEAGPYMIGRQKFLETTKGSFRRAVREAQAMVDAAVLEHERNAVVGAGALG